MNEINIENLIAVIKEVHAQHADDLCWMDIDRIFRAIGLPVPDRHVGDKCAMLENCKKFINIMCEKGKWKSYAELEKELKDYKHALHCSTYKIRDDIYGYDYMRMHKNILEKYN